jgi:hypothetical protein
VSWNGSFSHQFPLLAGGCLSPILFSLCVNCIIKAIHKSGLGCSIDHLNFGILMYADDLVLISASLYKLQKMINICLDEFHNLDLTINVKKSDCIRFGPRHSVVSSNLCVDNAQISWSDNIKYLGIVFVSGNKLGVDLKSSRTNFFRSFNSIYSKISKANEVVIVSLINSHCLPTILYGLEAIDLNTSALNKLDNPLFLAFAKIFHSFDKNVVYNCMFYTGSMPLRYEFWCRKINFLSKLKSTNNILLSHLFANFGLQNLAKLCNDLNLNVGEANGNVKRLLTKQFETTLLT